MAVAAAGDEAGAALARALAKSPSGSAEALALGEGVCQDHAHALIAIARERGLPARYVSGYLHVTSDGAAHDAAHAWAEIHVGALGWVGFDAANACCRDWPRSTIGAGYPLRLSRASSFHGSCSAASGASASSGSQRRR